MSDFQNLLNNMAIVVGGSRNGSMQAGFYSGSQVGDGSGVAGLNGCYSRAPFIAEDPPVGILLPTNFKEQIPGEGAPLGHRIAEDVIRLLLIVKKVEMRTDMAILTPFRDLVPAAFDAHMTLQPTGGITLNPSVLMAHVLSGRIATISWGGGSFYGWAFDIGVLRMPAVTFATT